MTYSAARRRNAAVKKPRLGVAVYVLRQNHLQGPPNKPRGGDRCAEAGEVWTHRHAATPGRAGDIPEGRTRTWGPG